MLSIFKGIRFFKRSHDGGKGSGVTGFWLIEWKAGFSIVFLRFSIGSREAFHSHAFNAFTWWLKGSVQEHFQDGSRPIDWRPSFKPKYTPRNCFHKIIALRKSYAISFRGPWSDTWQENKQGATYTLTHGRNVVK